MTILLVATIWYNGQVLYPYYCTRKWICDYVTEETYRTRCRRRSRAGRQVMHQLAYVLTMFAALVLCSLATPRVP